MAESMYFIVHNSEGDTTVSRVTESELRKRLKIEDGAHWYGHGGFMSIEDLADRGGDTNYWKDDLLIIKGEVMVPQPKEVVTEWEF